MRDPARIEPTLKMIEILWKRYPDMRLGQIMLNLDSTDDNLWNLEDEELQIRIALVLGDKWDAVGKRAALLQTERAS